MENPVETDNEDTNNAGAKEHPLIKEFVTLVEETVGDGFLEFSHLQLPAFMKFWKHFLIYRFEEDIDDFRIMLFGTNFVPVFEQDCTGQLLSDLKIDYQIIHTENIKVLDEKCNVYISSRLFGLNKEYKKYDLVRLPLQRNGTVNEVLSCVIFS